MTKYPFTEKKDTRSGFGAGMTELGRTNPNVVTLCADLVGSLKIDTFIKENPERFIQCGKQLIKVRGCGFNLRQFINPVRKETEPNSIALLVEKIGEGRS